MERLACASSQPVSVETSSTEPCDVEEEPAATVEAHCTRPVFLLDLFCGTAGVAAAFNSCGGEALGIDHVIDKRRVKGPVSKVDLSKRPGQRTVIEWLEADKVDAFMLAPPCGTASRAREIPIPRRHQLRKGMQPAPLRSEAEPMGLAHLKGIAKLKVATANRLYAFTRKVINLCVSKGIPFICENPRSETVLDVENGPIFRPS